LPGGAEHRRRIDLLPRAVATETVLGLLERHRHHEGVVERADARQKIRDQVEIVDEIRERRGEHADREIRNLRTPPRRMVAQYRDRELELRGEELPRRTVDAARTLAQLVLAAEEVVDVGRREGTRELEDRASQIGGGDEGC